MKDPDQFFLDLVERMAEQSRCRSRQVGAVIAVDNRVVSEGWNSAPKGSLVENCERCNAGNIESGTRMEMAICTHAEANAICNAVYMGVSLKNTEAVLYCTHFPCGECAKLIVTSGIKEVVFRDDYNATYPRMFFKAAGVSFRPFSPETASDN